MKKKDPNKVQKNMRKIKHYLRDGGVSQAFDETQRAQLVHIAQEEWVPQESMDEDTRMFYLERGLIEQWQKKDGVKIKLSDLGRQVAESLM